MTEPKKILYAWELGSNYGHVSSFLPLAQQLRTRGHEVTLAIKDLSQIQALPGISDFEVIQAPVWLPEIKGLPEPQVCYPDILQRFGYLDDNGLTGMFKAWRALYRMVQPQLLIADHAPTAILASRNLGFPRAMFGNGFFSPPRTTPMPSMRPLLPVTPDRLTGSEQAILPNINRVLAAQGLAPLNNLAAMLDVEEDFLITPEEFDHYRERGPARYYGPLLNLPAGSRPDWPDAPGTKLFAYIKPGQGHFQRLLNQLRESQFCVLAHAPGLSNAHCRQLETPNLRISPLPVDMSYACTHARAVICNAGHGTVMNACLAGLPVLALPMYVEQNLTARNIERIGAGIMVLNREKDPDFVAILNELVDNPAYIESARAFADKYADLDQQALLESLATRCDKLLVNTRIGTNPATEMS